MAVTIGAVNPATPWRVVGHVAGNTFFAIGHDEWATGGEVEGAILTAEGIDHRPVVVLMVFTRGTKFIGDTLVAITLAIFVGVNEAGELRFLGNVVGIFFLVVVNTVGLHQPSGKQAPVALFIFPYFTFP